MPDSECAGHSPLWDVQSSSTSHTTLLYTSCEENASLQDVWTTPLALGHIEACLPASSLPPNTLGVWKPGECVDGKEYWYCCSCGDGPNETWDPSCRNCGHVRDKGCSVEQG
ncbi:hypothetical protein CC80DRAFT_492351 [Byssothecium circinans]|uniref:Uncharacterized protein n=1 Tax=Byssothecium circinans TaxID=147558 RepID=A0A6A5TUE3_9PLEO|nr:hypothetical protein CC80DRAFT_492351 [Byssothecium circinans]